MGWEESVASLPADTKSSVIVSTESMHEVVLVRFDELSEAEAEMNCLALSIVMKGV